MPKIAVLLLVFIGVAFSIFADIKFKSARDLLSFDFALGMAGYIGCGFVAYATFRMAGWGWLFIVWSMLSLSAGLAFSVFYYGEPFTTRRMISSAMLLIAIALAE